jgi:polyprenyldihydroxybenzoate methyltransferase/3-demethylubiquinol 3-O-methyltransferase
MTKSSIYRQSIQALRNQSPRQSIKQTLPTLSARVALPPPNQINRRSISTPSSSSSSSSDPFSTVNADEISHFSRLSSEWWSQDGEFALLHRMNPTRVEYIRQKLLNRSEPEWTFETRHAHPAEGGTGKWLKDMNVLDVGCGGGLLAESLARLGGDVLAIDAGRENIEIARIHAESDPFLPIGDRARGGEKLEYRCVPAERLREEGKQFDLVTSMEVIEHVDEPGQFLKCLGDMVKVSLYSAPPPLDLSLASIFIPPLVPNSSTPRTLAPV